MQPNPPSTGPIRARLTALPGDVSGAFGDLGTFLPYVVAVVGTGLLAPGPVFLGFSAGYLGVALIYRVPVPIQPMKVLGAMILAGGLSATQTAWAGALIGAVLLALAATPALARMASAVPQMVLTGLQAGLGLILGALALRMIATDWRIALPALATLALSYHWRRGPWALLVVIAAILAGPHLSPGPALPPPHPATGGVISGVLAQLPLTLLNAVVVAATLAKSLFPQGADRISARRLAATSGALNLIFAPFGALPMCHGAGGLSAHYRFGARGAGAPVIIGSACALAAMTGPEMMRLLAAIPQPVLGALLIYAAADLILTRRLIDARGPGCAVIGLTALGTFFAGALIGLIAGLMADILRRRSAGARDGADGA